VKEKPFVKSVWKDEGGTIMNIEIKESNSGKQGVINLLKKSKKMLSAREVAERLGIGESTCSTLLKKLRINNDIGYARQKIDGNGHYMYVYWKK